MGEPRAWRNLWCWAFACCASACNQLVGIGDPHDLTDGSAQGHDASRSDASKSDVRETSVATDVLQVEAGDASGEPEVPCASWIECGDGRYCDDTGVCRPCADLTAVDAAHVRFAQPEPLKAINDNAAMEAVRLPRTSPRPTGLFYVRDFFATQMWETLNFDRNAGGPVPSPVDDADLTESAPLAPTFVTQGQLAGYNFFFDRNVGKTDRRRELYGASLDAAGVATKVTRLPAPFNATPPTMQWSSSIAVAKERAWWVANLDGSLNTYIMTSSLEPGARATAVSINLPPGCPLHEIDAVPWVTPDGSTMLVTAVQHDAACNTPDQHTDVFLVRLDATGQPLATAASVEGIDQPTTSEADASLSADMCWLYFASDRVTENRIRILRAHRGR
jgi:hypothetical protein